MNRKIYDVAIIGSGPAGLTSAMFAVRYGMKVIVFEKLMPGGQIVFTDRIENYPGFAEGISGRSLANKFQEHAKKYDISFRNQEVLDLREEDSQFVIKLENSEVKALSIIIATGAQPKKLSIPGEKEFTGKGVSYCATCDAPFYKGKDVVTIGGGNTALEEALYLSNIVNSVKLIHRRDRLRAMQIYQKRIEEKDNIELVLQTVPVEILGDEKVESIKVKHLGDNKVSLISCDGVFVFVGYIPNTGFLKDFVKLDSKGYIVTDSNMQTSRKGIFAAGDVRVKNLRQVITACSDGAVASDSAFRYITNLKGTSYPGWKE